MNDLPILWNTEQPVKKKLKKKSTSEKVQEAKKSFPNIPLFI